MNSSNKGSVDPMLERAARRLLDGGLVAFPTETVYGLGADAENIAAVARIYAAKGRPANHPVIVHLHSGADIAYWVKYVPREAQRLIDAFWPGPLTLILQRADNIPDAVSGGQSSVGLRCPSHPVAQALLRRFAELKGGHGGVAAPSANLFGQVSPTRAEHVRAEFAALDEDELLILEGGASEVGIESTIVDLSRLDEGVGPVVLRPGHVTAAQIAEALGVEADEISVPAENHAAVSDRDAGSGDNDDAVLARGSDSSEGDATSLGSRSGSGASGTRSQSTGTGATTPRVSGSLKAHYAPRTPLWLVSKEQLLQCVEKGVSAGERVACVAFSRPEDAAVPDEDKVDWFVVQEDAALYARELYALLRRLDRGGYARLVFERPPRLDSWRAVNDRLGRAAAAFGH